MEKQTLGKIASQRLLEMIQKDGYMAGDKPPTEAELVELLGIGRNVMWEALRILISRNIATTYQGSGTFISDKSSVSDDPLESAMIENRREPTEDLIQVRVMLELSIAALATQNATVEDICQLENILLGLKEQMILRGDYADEDSQFHAQVTNYSHNLVITNLVPIITNGVRVFVDAVQETEYKQTLKSHRRIFEAIRDRKPVETQQTMYFHLMYSGNHYKSRVGDGKRGMKETRAKEQ